MFGDHMNNLTLSASVRRTILNMIDDNERNYKRKIAAGITGIAVYRKRVNALNKVLAMAEAYQAQQPRESDANG